MHFSLLYKVFWLVLSSLLEGVKKLQVIIELANKNFPIALVCFRFGFSITTIVSIIFTFVVIFTSRQRVLHYRGRELIPLSFQLIYWMNNRLHFPLICWVLWFLCLRHQIGKRRMWLLLERMSHLYSPILESSLISRRQISLNVALNFANS